MEYTVGTKFLDETTGVVREIVHISQTGQIIHISTGTDRPLILPRSLFEKIIIAGEFTLMIEDDPFQEILRIIS